MTDSVLTPAPVPVRTQSRPHAQQRPRPRARTRPTGGVFEISDVEARRAWGDRALGLFNQFILFALAAATIGFVALSVAGNYELRQRLAFITAALITGGALFGLRNRLNKSWAWSRLPRGGAVRVSKKGLQIRHGAVIDGEVRIPWAHIKAITLDSGRNHDDKTNWRRFPLPSPYYNREYLFDTLGESRPEFSLIAARPVAPNIAILLNRPIPLRNPNSHLTEVAFPSHLGNGLPAEPPAKHTASTGLFLRTSDLKKTRDLLLPSGKLRALRTEDVH